MYNIIGFIMELYYINISRINSYLDLKIKSLFLNYKKSYGNIYNTKLKRKK